jgi:MerR family copper efflux transcriptional regulator
MMKIGDLAQRTGLKPSAIRFYEASGLLPSGARGANGYRLYTEAAVERLRLIQLAQRLGFSLDTLRPLLARDAEGLPHDAVLRALAQRRAEIQALRHALDAQETELERLAEACRTEWAQGRCVDLGALAPQPAATRPPRQRRRQAAGLP